MNDVKWIKLSTGIFDNRKMRQIESMPEGDTLIVIWLKLLILAGNVNDGGAVWFTRDIPYTDELLATEFNRPLKVVQLALATFRKFDMIEIVDDVILVSNWEKYQNVGGMDKIREQTRQRVAAYRERKRQAIPEVCNVTSNATVTQGNATDIDKEIDIDIDTTPLPPPEGGGGGDNAISMLIKQYPDIEAEAVKYAYEVEADGADNRRRYVKSILDRWRRAGIRTLEQAKADSVKHPRAGGKPKKPMDERDVTEAEFKTGFYADIMNRPRQTG